MNMGAFFRSGPILLVRKGGREIRDAIRSPQKLILAASRGVWRERKVFSDGPGLDGTSRKAQSTGPVLITSLGGSGILEVRAQLLLSQVDHRYAVAVELE